MATGGWFDSLDEHDKEAYHILFERYVSVPNELLAVLGIEEAYFLCWLINWGKLKGDRRNKGFFYCPHKSIQRKLRMHRQKQWRLLSKLREMEFIDFDTVRAGGDLKNRRWLKINFCEIRKAIIAKYREDDWAT